MTVEEVFEFTHLYSIYIFLSNLPVQTTFEPLLWLLSTETWPELSLVSEGVAETDDVPRDCITRGFL